MLRDKTAVRRVMLDSEFCAIWKTLESDIRIDRPGKRWSSSALQIDGDFGDFGAGLENLRIRRIAALRLDHVC